MTFFTSLCTLSSTPPFQITICKSVITRPKASAGVLCAATLWSVSFAFYKYIVVSSY